MWAHRCPSAFYSSVSLSYVIIKDTKKLRNNPYQKWRFFLVSWKAAVTQEGAKTEYWNSSQLLSPLISGSFRHFPDQLYLTSKLLLRQGAHLKSLIELKIKWIFTSIWKAINTINPLDLGLGNNCLVFYLWLCGCKYTGNQFKDVCFYDRWM